MAERRMFAKTIIDSDAFLDMPVSSQALYFHLGMRADDDGFINNPKKILRMVGASDDDLRVLMGKRFIIPFESGVVVIKHWKIHNYIQNDRYKETVYQEEKSRLIVKGNKAYSVDGLDTDCIQDGYSLETQDRLGKDSIGKDIKERDKREKSGKSDHSEKPKRPTFTPPSPQEVTAYCIESGIEVDANAFCDYYESNGWMVGKNKMKSWKAAVRNWERHDRERNKKTAVDDDFDVVAHTEEMKRMGYL